MMSRSRLAIFALTLGGFAASLAALPVHPRDPSTLDALGAVSAVLENRHAPDLQFVRPDGTVQRLTDFRGEVVYLNIWARFCDTCRAEMPSLVNFAREYADRLSVVTVAIDEDPSAATSYLAQAFPEGTDFHVLLDPGGSAAANLGTLAVPETYVIQRDGTVLARLVGGQEFGSPAHRALAELVLHGE